MMRMGHKRSQLMACLNGRSGQQRNEQARPQADSGRLWRRGGFGGRVVRLRSRVVARLCTDSSSDVQYMDGVLERA